MVFAAALGGTVDGSADDTAAFEARLQPLYMEAVRLAYGLLRNSALAEDAAQDAALRAWRSRGNLREGSELRPWFLAIVANCCRDVRRSSWWRLGGSPPPMGGEPPAPDLTEHREAIYDLRDALRRLGHRDRLVIVLRYYLDLSHEDVAAVTGQSETAVRARVSRALRRLRLDLAAEDDL
ncbi:MAG: RNA polymerase sigma factor [Candidatus Dormibacteria bacterium]